MKKVLSMILAGALVLSMASCSQSGGKGNTASVTFDSLKLGQDYKNIKANIKCLTTRTDIVNTIFKKYTQEFSKLYPNVKITYEADTNYQQDMTVKLTTNNWGDVCLIPTNVNKNQLSAHFVSFGKQSVLSQRYQFLNNFSYQGNTYGIPSDNVVQGIVYNKAVFKKAGITTLPKTPDEFLADLQLIKEKTDAIPLYTNFAAGWPMGAWDAYISGGATGDPNATTKLTHTKNPFSKPKDGSQTGPYYVYYTLYQAVQRKLTEADPTTTDWEGSKTKMNNGKIATMVLGTWAVVQMQQAGSHPDDVGYMPFPITVKGKQYASAAPDYNYGINKYSSKDNQIASMLYIKWLVEKSNEDVRNGNIPVVITHSLPDSLKSFTSAKYVVDNPAPAGEEDLFNKINKDSELGINTDNQHVMDVVEAAIKGSPSFDSLIDSWNKKWTDAEQSNNSIK